jgi:hypothetical protein
VAVVVRVDAESDRRVGGVCHVLSLGSVSCGGCGVVMRRPVGDGDRG